MNTLAPGSGMTVKTSRVTIAIFGLGCGGGGSLTVERALTKVPGVVRAYVNPATEMAYIEFNPTECSCDQLVSAIKRTGFDAGKPTLR